MQAQLSLDSESIAIELHALLQELDPSRLSAALYQEIQTKFRNLHQQIEATLERAANTSPNLQLEKLRALLNELAELLRKAWEATRDESDRKVRQQFLDFRKRLQTNYQKLSKHLDTLQIHVPSLRPTNYRRSLVHACGGLFGLFMVEYVLNPNTMILVAGLFFTYAWSMEFIRRRAPGFNEKIMAFYGPIAHPHEHHRINSATWYCTALVCLALTAEPMAVGIALVVLGLADPMAALVGRKWGRIRLINGRSLEGSLAFFVTAFFTCVTVVAIWHPGHTWAQTLMIAGMAGFFGAIGELVSGKIDDNLLTPLAAAAGVSLALSFI